MEPNGYLYMKRSYVIWVVAIVVIIIAGGIWYWASSMGSTGTPAVGTTSTSTTSTHAGMGAVTPAPRTSPRVPATPSSTSIIVLNTESTTTIGTYLTGTNGMTLYISKSDRARVSNCTGSCAVAWPPYTISTSTAATLLGSTSGISGSIGAITRTGGVKQVTYNNMPLYFYAGDKSVGDIKGNNIDGFVIVSL